jgi:hypothetical protein
MALQAKARRLARDMAGSEFKRSCGPPSTAAFPTTSASARPRTRVNRQHRFKSAASPKDFGLLRERSISCAKMRGGARQAVG